MDTESTTIQDDLIKKILEFPYETLGIQKGGIYGDETFNKEGYLSDSNISALRERLIKYKIIGFEFGNFGKYEVKYGWENNSVSSDIWRNTQILNGSYVYVIYFDETGNCYGYWQITNILHRPAREGQNIPWADELFIMPFTKWVGVDPYVSYCNWTQHSGHYYHWTVRNMHGYTSLPKEIQKPTGIEPSRIQSFLQHNKLIDVILICKQLSTNGDPNRNGSQYFKNITLAQVEECENIEAEKLRKKEELRKEEIRKEEEERIKEEIRLIDLTLEEERKREIVEKNEKLTQILEWQKVSFLSENKEYLNSSILSIESKTRPPPKYESYFNYLCSVYGNIYENLYSMINCVVNKKSELFNIIFTENESERFLLMYRKHKSTDSFNKLDSVFYENGHLSVYDITKPIVLLSICNVEPISTYVINMIERRNTLDINLDDIIILIDVLKNCISEGVIPFNRVNKILMQKWITKKEKDLWTDSMEKTVFQLSVTKRLIVNSVYCNKLTELDNELDNEMKTIEKYENYSTEEDDESFNLSDDDY